MPDQTLGWRHVIVLRAVPSQVIATAGDRKQHIEWRSATGRRGETGRDTQAASIARRDMELTSLQAGLRAYELGLVGPGFPDPTFPKPAPSHAVHSG